MRTIEPGLVALADRRTQRRWQVAVAGFELGEHPVTQAEYAAVTGVRPSAASGDRLPVESVSWLDAVVFCNALSRREGLAAAYRIDGDSVEWDGGSGGYRLPTSAEWEYACRAGSTAPRYGVLHEIAWYSRNSGERVHEVGRKLPNRWGLHDMLGNVWEWCWDLYDPEVYGSYRVLKGGGWLDPQWSVRAGVRRRSHPTYRIDDVGFRIARSP